MRVRVKDDGRSVEDICFEWLKQETGDHERAARMAAGGFVERLLEINPGLAAIVADNADAVPAGTVLLMPTLPDDSVRQTIKLW